MARERLPANEKLAFFGSLIIIVVAGLMILFTNFMSNRYQGRIRSNITEQLWGFTPALVGKDRNKFYIWSWRKLVVAGVMLASLIFALICRLVHIEAAVYITVALYGIYIAGLWIFWYVSISNLLSAKTEASNEKRGEAGSKHEPIGWSAKLRSDDTDQRLPVTVITGYL